MPPSSRLVWFLQCYGGTNATIIHGGGDNGSKEHWLGHLQWLALWTKTSQGYPSTHCGLHRTAHPGQKMDVERYPLLATTLIGWKTSRHCSSKDKDFRKLLQQRQWLQNIAPAKTKTSEHCSSKDKDFRTFYQQRHQHFIHNQSTRSLRISSEQRIGTKKSLPPEGQFFLQGGGVAAHRLLGYSS